MKFTEALDFKKLVTYIPNKIEPVHNWYYFKEGFSKQLVDTFIQRFGLNSKSLVLEPFCGSGTTPLACKQHGIRSVGFEVSPFFAFVSKVKTRDYDLEKLKRDIDIAISWKFERPESIPNEKHIRKVFSKYTLQDAIFYKNKIMEIENNYSRDFLLLGLIDSAMKSSWTKKDGAVVKIQKKGKPPLKKFFKYKIKKMFKDLKRSNIKPVETQIILGDSRNLSLDNETVDAVITSPPYLNKIEYSKIYNIETSLFFDFPKSKVRSYIGSKVDEFGSEIGFSDFPLTAKAYFSDMNDAIKEMYRVCKDGSKLAVVIGGGCYPDRAIECDRITAELAEKVGFKVEEILVARNSWCTRARTIKVGQVRESIILLEK
ncbi:MAG: DNA adenine methylase [Candidatus Aenigmarchaeota archaeon]|nr:DNA adenine methylase [Candidatus Aenigmarchaeota archaeon]